MNSLIAGVAAALTAASGLFVGHGAVGTPVSPSIISSTSTQSGKNTACIYDAVVARESSLQTNFETYANTVENAYSKRSVSIAAAYQQTGNGAIVAAAKAANQAFASTTRSARTTWIAADKQAKTTFTTAWKACGGKGTAPDESNADTVSAS